MIPGRLPIRFRHLTQLRSPEENRFGLFPGLALSQLSNFFPLVMLAFMKKAEHHFGGISLLPHQLEIAVFKGNWFAGDVAPHHERSLN